MANLERRWGLPLLRQLSYEWTPSETAYPDVPFQGDLSCFVRPGDYAAGGFANKICLRVLTAFIRTMEVARSVWGVPYDLVFRSACKALPLEPSLPFLRPARPTWLPALRLDVAADTASVMGFNGDARVELEAMDSDGALFALATPLHVSNNEFVELTVVRWRRWGSASVDATSPWQGFQRRQHRDFGRLSAHDLGLKSRIPSLSLAEVIDNDGQTVAMAVLHDVEPIGYLQRDLDLERLYLPTLTGMSIDLVVEPSGGELSISAAGQAIATLAYWNAG